MSIGVVWITDFFVINYYVIVSRLINLLFFLFPVLPLPFLAVFFLLLPPLLLLTHTI